MEVRIGRPSIRLAHQPGRREALPMHQWHGILFPSARAGTLARGGDFHRILPHAVRTSLKDVKPRQSLLHHYDACRDMDNARGHQRSGEAWSARVRPQRRKTATNHQFTHVTNSRQARQARQRKGESVGPGGGRFEKSDRPQRAIGRVGRGGMCAHGRGGRPFPRASGRLCPRRICGLHKAVMLNECVCSLLIMR